MMPARMSAAYDNTDVFELTDPPGGERPFALRAETTDGSYAIARHIRQVRPRSYDAAIDQLET